MSASAPVSSSTGKYGSEFWERMWRTAGIQSVACFVLAYFLYVYLPVIASLLGGLAVLNLMWFAAAIRTTLADSGRDGWGAAATASSSAAGMLILLLIALAALGLNELTLAGVVVSSFPRAMLIMAGSFGFWRAGLISNSLFAACVAAVVLVLLGGITWASGGFWAPDGAYSLLISPLIGLAWILFASWVLLARAPAARSGW